MNLNPGRLIADLLVGPSVLLIIDDDMNTLELMERAAKSVGLRVKTESQVDLALGYLARNIESVGLVLLDVKMPGGLEGWDVRRIFHERWPKLPIVMMSGVNQNFGDAPDNGEVLSITVKPMHNLNEWFRVFKKQMI